MIKYIVKDSIFLKVFLLFSIKILAIYEIAVQNYCTILFNYFFELG